MFVLVLALQFLKKLLFPTDLAWLPGPRDWPFPLCSIMFLVSVRRHGGLHNLEQYSYHKYGKLCRLLDLAGGYRVLVADPETVKQILVKEFHKFPDRGMPLKLMPPLDAELFLSKYPRWKRMRKVLSPTFSAARLKQVVPLISDACERLEAKVEKLADTGRREWLGVSNKFIGSNKYLIIDHDNNNNKSIGNNDSLSPHLHILDYFIIFKLCTFYNTPISHPLK